MIPTLLVRKKEGMEHWKDYCKKLPGWDYFTEKLS